MKDLTLWEAVQEARKRWGDSGGATLGPVGVCVVGVWTRADGERERLEVRGAGTSFRRAFEVLDAAESIAARQEGKRQ